MDFQNGICFYRLAIRQTNLTTTMTGRTTDSFDTYYDEITDEQYQMDAADDFPKLVRLDLTPIKEARERMEKVIREIDLRLAEYSDEK